MRQVRTGPSPAVGAGASEVPTPLTRERLLTLCAQAGWSHRVGPEGELRAHVADALGAAQSLFDKLGSRLVRLEVS